MRHFRSWESEIWSISETSSSVYIRRGWGSDCGLGRKHDPIKLYAHVERVSFAMRFCEADLCCSPLRLFSGAGFDATINRMGRRSSGIHHRFPRGIHITHYHSQSIACWPFLSRDSQPHLPNSSFLRLRSGSFAPQLPDDTVPCRSDLGMPAPACVPEPALHGVHQNAICVRRDR